MSHPCGKSIGEAGNDLPHRAATLPHQRIASAIELIPPKTNYAPLYRNGLTDPQFPRRQVPHLIHLPPISLFLGCTQRMKR